MLFQTQPRLIEKHACGEIYAKTPHCKCNSVPGELSSKFNASEKSYGAGNVIQTSKCVSLQVMHYSEGVEVITVLCKEQSENNYSLFDHLLL